MTTTATEATDRVEGEVARVPKSIQRGEYFVATRSTYKGTERVDIRIYYTDARTGELKPTAKGIGCAADEMESVLGALIDALRDGQR